MATSFHNPSLLESDSEIANLIQQEKARQVGGLELIASENFTSKAVMEALSSCLTNKYAEGLPGHRYYGGNEIVDQVESLCIKRALEAFHLNADEWGVNVQPYSGSTANFSALTALLKPHQRLMGLDLPSGGHLTHGYQTAKKKISSSSIYFESMPYQISAETGVIDYDRLAQNARLFRPNLLITGASAYPRDWDYKRMREIANEHEAYLMCDMAHISGLVAAEECNNPFEYCDLVTTTTHKTLRGPRSGIIFFRKTQNPHTKVVTTDLEERVNFAVFPSNQGGPHENTIAAVAVALKEAATPEFKTYIRQVKANTKALCAALQKANYSFVTGGSDNHLLLWDVRPLELTGSKLEKLYDKVHITVNKNAVYGDVSALSPGGVRLGTPALTTRGFGEQDMAAVAELLIEGVKLAQLIQGKHGKKLADFVAAMELEEYQSGFDQLREKVNKLSLQFGMPGI